MTEDTDWIIEFERLARPRLQKIFEKDLVGLPAALAERLEQLRKSVHGYEEATPNPPRVGGTSLTHQSVDG